LLFLCITFISWKCIAHHLNIFYFIECGV
jgi:hypothetical protein